MSRFITGQTQPSFANCSRAKSAKAIAARDMGFPLSHTRQEPVTRGGSRGMRARSSNACDGATWRLRPMPARTSASAASLRLAVPATLSLEKRLPNQLERILWGPRRFGSMRGPLARSCAVTCSQDANGSSVVMTATQRSSVLRRMKSSSAARSHRCDARCRGGRR